MEKKKLIISIATAIHTCDDVKVRDFVENFKVSVGDKDITDEFLDILQHRDEMFTKELERVRLALRNMLK